MKKCTAPAEKLVTVILDGVEVPYCPEQEYPDTAEFVFTDKLAEIPGSYKRRGVEPYRAAVMVNAGGLDRDNSVLGAIQGGAVDDGTLRGAVINSTSDDFTAVINDGGTFTIQDSVLNFHTNSDGKHVNDFTGYGAVLAGFRGAKFRVERTKFNCQGVAKPAVFCDDRTECLFKDCNVAICGGKLYDGYVNSANQNTMVAPPWVLGISGNARGINLMGDRGTAYVIDTCFKANQWGVFSTDAGQNMHLYVVDSDMILLGENVPESDAQDPYAVKYGSGYGSYLIGKAYEEFSGADIKVGAHGAVLRRGTALYKSSKGTIQLISPITGETVYEAPGKGRNTRIEAEFALMAHGDGTVTYTEGTEIYAGSAAFLVKSSGVTVNVLDGTTVHAEKGVLFQMMDDDDNIVGTTWTEHGPVFNTEFHEPEGWPSENGMVTCKMPLSEQNTDPFGFGAGPGPDGPEGAFPGPVPEGGGDQEPEGPGAPGFQPDCYFRAENVTLTGDIFNGSGYYRQIAKPLHVDLGANTVLTGAISATETRHVDENGKQNTFFTIKEYYYLGHVENRNYFGGENTVDVTLRDGAVWNVTAPGIINSLSVGEGCRLNGRVRKNLDGTLTVMPAAEGN